MVASVRGRGLPLALSGAILLGNLASAQDETDPTLEEKVRALEEHNESLELRVFELEDADAQQTDLEGMVIRYGEVDATFFIFGNTGARYSDIGASDDWEFDLGSLSFFANAQFGDHFRILSETVIEAAGDGSAGVSQERLWGMWTFEDWFYAKLGTEHSPVSRWNQLYHHGRYLEPTILRPSLARFEGGDGVLALHRTGLELGGTVQAEAGMFNYFATVGNGRGSSPSDKQREGDDNSSKAVDVGLAFTPAALENLRVGVAAIYDEVPPDPTSPDPALADSIQEMVVTANLDYRGRAFRVLSEYAWIEHDADATGANYGSETGYVQLELPHGKWAPYVRFDFRDMETGNPFYMQLDRDLDRTQNVLGVRYDPIPHMAMKLEVAFGTEEFRDGAGVVDERDVTLAGFQLSWMF